MDLDEDKLLNDDDFENELKDVEIPSKYLYISKTTANYIFNLLPVFLYNFNVLLMRKV